MAPNKPKVKSLIDSAKEFAFDVSVYYDRIMARGCIDPNEVDRQARIDVVKALASMNVILALIEQNTRSASTGTRFDGDNYEQVTGG